MARPEGVPADAVYDENDKTWAVGAQQGGRRVGAWRYYDVDGRQSAEATFDDAGAPMSWKTFSSQGAVIDEGAYDSGGFVARATWWRRTPHAAPTWMPAVLVVPENVARVEFARTRGAPRPSGAIDVYGNSYCFFDENGRQLSAKGKPLKRTATKHA